MKRVMLTVAYDGTGYHGWQIQDNGATVEGELTKAVNKLTNEVNELIGGSRTDAGVHAMGNVAVFDTECSIPGEKFSYALNQRLPEDIRVIKSEEVAPDFHPRHCDSVKTYEYHIYNAEFPMPVKRLYAHFSYSKFDLEAMNTAASFIVGEHDFSSFCAAGAQVDSKIRTVYSCTVSRNDDEIIICVKGNGFLYNMVRIIAGTLMEVGRGHIKPEKISAIIEAKERSKAGPTAPACGLILKNISFYLPGTMPNS